MQKVDPFIPVNKRPVQSPQPRRHPVRNPSVDGLQSKNLPKTSSPGPKSPAFGQNGVPTKARFRGVENPSHARQRNYSYASSPETDSDSKPDNFVLEGRSWGGSKPRALPHLQNQSARYINPRPRLVSARPTPDPVKPESKNARSQKKARLSGVKKTLKILSQAIILIALFSLGFLLRSVVVGQAIILLYAIFAFVFKVESRITFALVLISFGVVLAASLRSDTALASVFAVYAFLLLVVGTISLGREVRNEI